MSTALLINTPKRKGVLWASSRSSSWVFLPESSLKAILPGDDPGGFIVTAIIGIVGALLGGFLAAALFGAHPLDEFFDISTWLTAIIGSIIVLVIYRMVTNRSGHGVRA